MIKEYIDKLSNDNQSELSNLEKQMRELLDELTYAQEWQESLQKENSSQTNIFSPRSFDENIEQDLENVQSKINRIKQRIEYTRELIETHLKKKNEYQTLIQEIDSIKEDKPEPDEVQSESGLFDAEEVKDLLNEIYKRTEICLAFLNSNKNRCKGELNEIKKMIKKFAEQAK